MISGINHTGLVVSDLEKLVAFYCDVMGLKVLVRRERKGGPIEQVVGYKSAHLKIAAVGAQEGHVLELIQYVEPPAAQRQTEERSVLGASHLAFDVEDVEQAYRHVTNGGARSLNPPVEVAPGKRVCYLQDPDGNWIELVEDKT